MTLTIGIDPGLSGAVAIFCDGQFAEVFDLPTMQSGGKQAFVQNAINAGELARMLAERTKGADVMVYVETVSAMPKQGVASMFSMGHTLGSITAVLAALGLPYLMVRPQEWKKAAGLLKTEKDQARTYAIRRFPAAAEYLARKKDHNRADAILIGSYGRMTRPC